jgi:hypothetical protein
MFKLHERKIHQAYGPTLLAFQKTARMEKNDVHMVQIGLDRLSTCMVTVFAIFKTSINGVGTVPILMIISLDAFWSE